MRQLRNGLSQAFHNTAGVAIAQAREIEAQRELRESGPGDHYAHPHPAYISQLADAERDQIDGFYGRISDDHAAAKFGAANLDEFSYWAWRSCGIADVQIVLETIQGNHQSTMDLVREGLQHHGYDVAKDKGWYHRALAEILVQHGLPATLDKFVPPSEMARQIAMGHFVIAAVKSATGGHLLLLYGFRLGEKSELVGFWCHDPNNYFEPGDGKFITVAAFKALSTRRSINVYTGQVHPKDA